VVHKRVSNRFNDQRSAGTEQQSNGSCTTSGSGIAFGVHGKIAHNDDSQSAIPFGTLEPSQGIKQSGSATITSIGSGNTLNIVISVLSEHAHEVSLDGFGLVEQSLCSYLHSADSLRRDIVLFEQRNQDSQADRINVFAITNKGHLLLTEADGVFTLGDLVVDLKVVLADICGREINLRTENSEHTSCGVVSSLHNYLSRLTLLLYLS